MLNGKLIDVDKLDYLMRDAYVTGYSSMMIDYERLISGYTIVSSTSVSGRLEYKIEFKKGSKKKKKKKKTKKALDTGKSDDSL